MTYSKHVYIKRPFGLKGYFTKTDFFTINFYDLDIKRLYINKNAFLHVSFKLIGKVKYINFKKYRVDTVKQQFYLGQWQVDVTSNTLSLGKLKRNLEPKTMDVLLLLCQHQGQVVSSEEIVAQCWPKSMVGDNPVHKAITNLRRALGDKASSPEYIETIRKRGYRIVADVQFLGDERAKSTDSKWKSASPYVGLSAFSANESQVYFGRDTLVRELVSRTAELFNRNRPFMMVLGSSGSGKSSLVHAGFLPKLLDKQGINGLHAHDFLSIDLADINTNASPFAIVDEIAAHMLDWGSDEIGIFEGYSASLLADKLLTSPQSVVDIVKRFCEEHELQTKSAYSFYAFIIDRLEVFLADTKIEDKDKRAVFTLLETLSQSNLFLVVLISRNDFYPLISSFEVLMKNKSRGAHLDIAPPSLSELGQIIKLPALAAELQWEHDGTTNATLDDVILSDASLEPNCLPLLQYTLQELYLQRDGNLLKRDTYYALGKIDGAIGHKAESTYSQMPASVQNALNTVLPLIVNLSGMDNTMTSKTASWDELKGDDERRFVELMVEQRLFVSFLNQGQASFKVAHEAVLRKWERVQQWIAQHQNTLSIRAALYEQAKTWAENDKDDAYLLQSGKPLLDASTLLDAKYIRLSNAERELIHQSQRKFRRKNLFKAFTAALLAALSVISFAAMLHSNHSQALAERKRLEAENLMGFMIGDFADKLRSVKRMDLLEGISEQALKYVTQAQESQTGWIGSSTPKPSFELRFQHALSLQAMAEVRFYRDDAVTAQLLYKEADKRLGALLEEQPDNFKLLLAAGANAFWLGDIELRNYNFALADEQFNRYLRFSEEMLKVSANNPDALLELSYATNSIGSVAFRQQDFDKALSFFESSLTYKQQLFEKSESPIITASAVADTYSWIASTQIHKGRIHEAQLTFAKAEAILEKSLANYSGNAEIIETLSLIKMNAAKSSQFTEDLNTSIEHLNDAKKLLIQLLEQDPANSSWQSYYKHARALLDYHRSLNAISALHNHNVKQDITIDELLRDGARLSSKIYAVLSYQYRQEWQISRNLLAQINIEHAIEEDLNKNIKAKFINVRELENYVLYQIASIRQTHNDAGKNIDIVQKECETLFSLTNSVVNVSKHPLFLQAHVFAGYCLNKQTAVAKHRRQLAHMNVPMPLYFTNINKELINDNTSEL